MSWFSDYFKVKTPEVKPIESIDVNKDMFAEESLYLKMRRKSGFENTILTGNKKPKLAAVTQLG